MEAQLNEAELLRFRSWQIALDHALSTANKSVRYLRFLHQRGLELELPALTYDHALGFMAEWRQRGVKPRTLNSWVREINLWSRFRKLGWKLSYFRRRSGPPMQVPDRVLVAKLLNLTYASPATQVRNRAMFAVFADVGIRRNELVHLQLSDRIQLGTGPGLRIRFGKGENERDVPLDPEVSELLERYVSTYRSHSHPTRLFTTQVGPMSYGYVGRVVQEAGARLGAPWLSCHKLRHFVADVTLDAGMPVSSVAEILGHKRWETTQLYRQRRLQKIRAEADFRATASSRSIFGGRMRQIRTRLERKGTAGDESRPERNGSTGNRPPEGESPRGSTGGD